MKKISRVVCAALVFTMAMGTLAACGKGNGNTKTNEEKYNAAVALIKSGDYEGAYAAFKELGDYKDAKMHLSRFIYFPTVINYNLHDRSGVMTTTLGVYNMPSRIFTEGVEIIDGEGVPYTKDGVYTYDEKGNVIQQAVNYNGLALAYDYTLDEENRLIKAELSMDGVVTSVNGYVYDENGLLIREDYVADGVVVYDYENTYDANGNRIKSEFKAEEGDHLYIYVFDENNKLISESGSRPDGYFYNKEHTYNEDGQRTQTLWWEYSELFATTTYTYDDMGRCTKEEALYYDDTKDIFAHEYDANGNLVKEVYTWWDEITVETVEMQYTFTYITKDIPDWTMSQMIGIFKIL